MKVCLLFVFGLNIEVKWLLIMVLNSLILKFKLLILVLYFNFVLIIILFFLGSGVVRFIEGKENVFKKLLYIVDLGLSK